MFMMQRESGWALDGRYQDIWKAETDEQGQKLYSNYITGQTQMRPPEQFRGGLLIDAPGLGKSLSILALIAADLEGWNDPDRRPNARRQTLLVVPKSRTLPFDGIQTVPPLTLVVIETWKDELLGHLKLASTIRSRQYVYYGKGRKAMFKSLDEYTLVITTYAVVRMDWKESSKRGDLDQREIQTLRRSIPIQLGAPEAKLYKAIGKDARHSLDIANGDSLFNTLRQVNSLRLVCNHGLQSSGSDQYCQNVSTTRAAWTQRAAQCHLDALGLAQCSNPACKQDLSSSLLADTDHEHEDEPYIEKDLTILCSGCHEKGVKDTLNYVAVCHHSRDVSAGCDDLFDMTITSSLLQDQGILIRPDYVPPKIERLVRDLQEVPAETKRLGLTHPLLYMSLRSAYISVVFSSWTKTLEMVRCQLSSKSIRSLRLDGTMSSTSRAKTLRTFRNDNDIRVLLVTISCGGVGLDLTAASRAFIIEFQALDRVHRLGQTKGVILARYITIGTREQKVITVQRKKQELADLTLGSGPIDKAKLTSVRMQYLKHFID
ncbi:MAG: hypothetical protein Q9228_001097 [Teloschistes exilis]